MNNAMAYTDEELGNPDLQEQDTFEAFRKNISTCSDYVMPLRGLEPRGIAGLKRNWCFP